MTTDNLKNYIPAPDAAAAVMNFFRKNGFEVGELVGTSFSITAPVDRFEGLFKTKLHCTERDVQVNCSRGNKYEIDIQPLPREVAADVMAITFTPPPDFGPTKFFAN